MLRDRRYPKSAWVVCNSLMSQSNRSEGTGDLSSQDARVVACTTSRRVIDVARRFPENIFVDEWDDYFFFDSDRVFDPTFVVLMQAVLTAERASCACISNLDTVLTRLSPEESSFVFERSTTVAEYLTALKGSPSKLGWIYGVDRFACTSDLGEWCIYCERRNELAVVATKVGITDVVQRKLVDGCKALRVDKAIAQTHIYALSARALSPEWRTALLKNYAK